MVNAASTSNPSFIVDVGEAYPYPSHVIAPNFVTMKLSGKDAYDLWETQIICLLTSHQMNGFIDGQFPCPDAGIGKGKVGEMQKWIISDSLVKGWILGSLSDGVAKKVVNHLKPKHKNAFTAKDIWDELQRSYGPWVREQAAAETKLTTRQAQSVVEVSSLPEDEKSKDGKTIQEKIIHEMQGDGHDKRMLYEFVLEQHPFVLNLLDRYRNKPWDKLTNNGNTVLHVAVSSSSTKNHGLLKKLLEMTPKDNTLLDLINSDGSTLLHVAAIGGNTEVVDILVERNPALLQVKDKEGHTPLVLSISNMHTETSECLFQHMKENEYGSYFLGKSGEEIVILAISCQDFCLARRIIYDFYDHPDAIFSHSDVVLTTLAQNFPRELNFWERGLRGDFMEEVDQRIEPYKPRLPRFGERSSCGTFWSRLLWRLLLPFIFGFYAIVIAFSLFLKATVHPFIKDTSQVYKHAKEVLWAVSGERLVKDKSINYRWIFEATRNNSYTFIRNFVRLFPDAIWSTNEDGHNFIQYSVINRSEKIYNLLYEMSEHKNIYKTVTDCSGNNLLHLAARLAPTNKLNLLSGAAMQIQRELQWFKEVEEFVCPLNRIQKNSDDETPEMVFTREHKDLVIEGENWIKKAAESYTITAALIVTIVFAAAITVPGGNNQESGIPIFTNNIAFRVFAISDAISLFTAVTSLLMFLSILTTRFAEQDFLFKLPRKLIIGLTMLFLSTTSMIIAFGATLFLVFGEANLMMLIPIGALTCLPITSFVTLQCPLIIELISATYGGGIFGNERPYGYSYLY